jgi:acetyl-CoA carboxylase, biotin carboxylase subunit
LLFPGGPGVRIDSHLFAGYRIPTHYDSLLAKIIVWSENRDHAIARMRRALSELHLEGVPTTAPFHLRVLDHPAFQTGDINTKFLERLTAEETVPEAVPQEV